MKFIKYLLFDLKQGILYNKLLLITPVAIAVITFLDFSMKANRFLNDGMIKEAVSYGDYWFYLYGGMKKYIPTPGDPFLFPVVWIVIFLILPFILLNYPFQDLYGIGQQIIVRSGRRTIWWLSKCGWNILGTLIYHFLIQVTGGVLFYIFHKDLSNKIHMDFVKLAFNAEQQEIWMRYSLPFMVIILPVIVSAAINLLQMTFSLFIKPVFGFFTVAAVLLSSAYLLSPALIGNYAMAYRCSWMLKEGVSAASGLILSIILLFLAAFLGLIKFYIYDILESE